MRGGCRPADCFYSYIKELTERVENMEKAMNYGTATGNVASPFQATNSLDSHSQMSPIHTPTPMGTTDHAIRGQKRTHSMSEGLAPQPYTSLQHLPERYAVSGGFNAATDGQNYPNVPAAPYADMSYGPGSTQRQLPSPNGAVSEPEPCPISLSEGEERLLQEWVIPRPRLTAKTLTGLQLLSSRTSHIPITALDSFPGPVVLGIVLAAAPRGIFCFIECGQFCFRDLGGCLCAGSGEWGEGIECRERHE